MREGVSNCAVFTPFSLERKGGQSDLIQNIPVSPLFDLIFFLLC